MLGHKIYLGCLGRQIVVCVPDLLSQNFMGSFQNLFSSSAAMTLTWGVWEILLRHLRACVCGSSSTPPYQSAFSGSVPQGRHLPLRGTSLAQVLACTRGSVHVPLVHPSPVGEPRAFPSSLLFASWCYSFPESLFELQTSVFAHQLLPPPCGRLPGHLAKSIAPVLCFLGSGMPPSVGLLSSAPSLTFEFSALAQLPH